VDDRPFGGGEGMLLKCEPIFWRGADVAGVAARGAGRACAGAAFGAGRKFDQATARRWSGLREVFLICGRYEGVDERVAEHLASEEVPSAISC